MFDGQAGLHYNYDRNYDPALGRYIKGDPIGSAGGVNPYGYVMSAPLSAIDPLGLAIYRGPSNYYSDIPPFGVRDQAVMVGDYIVGWIPGNFGTSTRSGCASDCGYGNGGWPSTPAANGTADNGGTPSTLPSLLSGAFSGTGTASYFASGLGCTTTASAGTSGASWYGGCGLGFGRFGSGPFSARPSFQGSLSTGGPTGWGVRANVALGAFGNSGSFSPFLTTTGGVVTVSTGPGSGGSANFTGGYRMRN